MEGYENGWPGTAVLMNWKVQMLNCDSFFVTRDSCHVCQTVDLLESIRCVQYQLILLLLFFSNADRIPTSRSGPDTFDPTTKTTQVEDHPRTA